MIIQVSILLPISVRNSIFWSFLIFWENLECPSSKNQDLDGEWESGMASAALKSQSQFRTPDPDNSGSGAVSGLFQEWLSEIREWVWKFEKSIQIFIPDSGKFGIGSRVGSDFQKIGSETSEEDELEEQVNPDSGVRNREWLWRSHSRNGSRSTMLVAPVLLLGARKEKRKKERKKGRKKERNKVFQRINSMAHTNFIQWTYTRKGVCLSYRCLCVNVRSHSYSVHNFF